MENTNNSRLHNITRLVNVLISASLTKKDNMDGVHSTVARTVKANELTAEECQMAIEIARKEIEKRTLNYLTNCCEGIDSLA